MTTQPVARITTIGTYVAPPPRPAAPVSAATDSYGVVKLSRNGSKTPQGPGLLVSDGDLELIEWAFNTLRRVVSNS